MTADVVIPVYRPDEKFAELFRRLQKQNYPIGKIIIIETESEVPLELPESSRCPVEVLKVKAEEFDHGGARNAGGAKSGSDIVIFMTQDAVPADTEVIRKLVEMLEQNPEVNVAYARQLPAKDCNIIERFTRSFNYPDVSRIKSREDIKELGIKTFFCSDVCAAYRREFWLKEGGFEEHLIFNEDMIFAGKSILRGGKVAYVAEARVIHSHNYSGMTQFKRNFDMAVSQAEYPELFGAVRSESEGIRLVKQTAAYLLKKGKPWEIIRLIYLSGCKYAGYLLGKRYKKLPHQVIFLCTSNKKYWNNKFG